MLTCHIPANPFVIVVKDRTIGSYPIHQGVFPMQSRMHSPAMIVPEAIQALQALGKALFASAEKTGVPSRTLFLAYLRASQINGDSVCVELHLCILLP
ncbi:carboxymuconolactone decarboxylase family protein [Paenibacillus periandrae]|uniref:carboxymuconolactone decarboxylase family protein n=1 Tax=Paenibacillus periandrae TaxID=1761741 RepID=UPI001F09E9C9|nr:carboxymuconolactone decarboxylase family protein [Paenibacillus periandrae]